MFGLGFVEILVILVVVLLVVGPDKLPEFSRSMGRTMWQLKRTADEFKREVNLTSLGVDPDMLNTEFEEIRSIADDCPDNPKNFDSPPALESSETTEPAATDNPKEPSS